MFELFQPVFWFGGTGFIAGFIVGLQQTRKLVRGLQLGAIVAGWGVLVGLVIVLMPLFVIKMRF